MWKIQVITLAVICACRHCRRGARRHCRMAPERNEQLDIMRSNCWISVENPGNRPVRIQEITLAVLCANSSNCQAADVGESEITSMNARNVPAKTSPAVTHEIPAVVRCRWKLAPPLARRQRRNARCKSKWNAYSGKSQGHGGGTCLRSWNT